MLQDIILPLIHFPNASEPTAFSSEVQVIKNLCHILKQDRTKICHGHIGQVSLYKEKHALIGKFATAQKQCKETERKLIMHAELELNLCSRAEFVLYILYSLLTRAACGSGLWSYYFAHGLL